MSVHCLLFPDGLRCFFLSLFETGCFFISPFRCSRLPFYSCLAGQTKLSVDSSSGFIEPDSLWGVRFSLGINYMYGVRRNIFGRLGHSWGYRVVSL